MNLLERLNKIKRISQKLINEIESLEKDLKTNKNLNKDIDISKDINDQLNDLCKGFDY